MASSIGQGTTRTQQLLRAVTVLLLALGGFMLGPAAGAQEDDSYTGVKSLDLEECLEFVPGLTLVSGEVAPGGDFVVSGDEYAAGAPINLYVCSTPILVGTGTADAAGAFEAAGAIPADLEAGAHDLFAYGEGADGEPRLIGLQFDVEAAPTPPGGPGNPNPPSSPAEPGAATLNPPAGGTTGGGTTGGTTAGVTSGGGGSPLATTGFGAALPSLLATALVVGGGLMLITVARKRREA